MREAFTAVRVGAKVNRDKRAGNLKNPLARGRGSESGADVRQVIRERERTHGLWRKEPPTDEAGYK
jgi:hypothetical protein